MTEFVGLILAEQDTKVESLELHNSYALTVSKTIAGIKKLRA